MSIYVNDCQYIQLSANKHIHDPTIYKFQWYLHLSEKTVNNDVGPFLSQKNKKHVDICSQTLAGAKRRGGMTCDNLITINNHPIPPFPTFSSSKICSLWISTVQIYDIHWPNIFIASDYGKSFINLIVIMNAAWIYGSDCWITIIC